MRIAGGHHIVQILYAHRATTRRRHPNLPEEEVSSQAAHVFALGLLDCCLGLRIKSGGGLPGKQADGN